MVACDGIWDCVTNEECVSKITDYYKEMKCKTDNVCPPVARLFDEICPDEMGDGIGTDNMTAILVKFK
jgi:protein phosphatase 2C family protein 2/3